MIELNEKQKSAVQSIEFPTLVVAVPGAGKTRVIVEKYAYLNSLGFPMERLVAITYTNKAANEMIQRIKARIPDCINNPYISTIHSFALRLMAENKKLFNFREDSTIIDEEESIQIILDIVERLKKEVKKDSSNDKNNFYDDDDFNIWANYLFEKISAAKQLYVEELILNVFSKAHHTLIENYSDTNFSLEQKYKEKVEDKFFLEYKHYTMYSYELKIFQEYQQYLYKNSLFDFNDLILYPYLTMKFDENVRNKIKSRFDYFLVDEFQDIDNLQNNFLLILSNGANITAVGDEDQAIYGFRFASIEPIMKFEKNFKNAKIIYMNRNYRSSKEIIKASNEVIYFNENRRNKRVEMVKTTKGHVEIKVFELEKEMVEYIVDVIKFLNDNFLVSLDNIAILVRAAFLLIAIQKKLIEKNIPFNIRRGANFFNRSEIKYTVYYLAFIKNLNNEFYFKKIVSYPKRWISKKTTEEIIKIKSTSDKNYLNILLEHNNKGAKEFGEILTKLSNCKTLTDFFSLLLNECKFIEEWGKKDVEEFDEIQQNFEFLTKIAKDLEDEYNQKADEIFQIFLSRVLPFFENENNLKGVVLGTLHSAKGLEFDAVILPYVSETFLPFERKHRYTDIEEERRLLYVGMTRAKDFLYIFHANYFRNKTNYELSPSEFIKPLFHDYLNKQSLVYSRFKVGEEIECKPYGHGKIINISKLNNGKLAYTVENSEGVMTFVEGLHDIIKYKSEY